MTMIQLISLWLQCGFSNINYLVYICYSSLINQLFHTCFLYLYHMYNNIYLSKYIICFIHVFYTMYNNIYLSKDISSFIHVFYTYTMYKNIYLSKDISCFIHVVYLYTMCINIYISLRRYITKIILKILYILRLWDQLLICYIFDQSFYLSIYIYITEDIIYFTLFSIFPTLLFPR